MISIVSQRSSRSAFGIFRIFDIAASESSSEDEESSSAAELVSQVMATREAPRHNAQTTVRCTPTNPNACKPVMLSFSNQGCIWHAALARVICRGQRL